MKKYLFYDIETHESITLESASIYDAMIASLDMVLEGTAKHPVFITVL